MNTQTPLEIANNIEEVPEGESNAIGILSQIRHIEGLSMVKAHAIVDGAVGFFESADGNTYEIVVRPKSYDSQPMIDVDPT